MNFIPPQYCHIQEGSLFLASVWSDFGVILTTSQDLHKRLQTSYPKGRKQLTPTFLHSILF